MWSNRMPMGSLLCEDRLGLLLYFHATRRIRDGTGEHVDAYIVGNLAGIRSGPGANDGVLLIGDADGDDVFSFHSGNSNDS